MGTDGTGDLVLLGRYLQGSDAGALDPIDWAQLDAVEALLSGHPQSPATLSTSPSGHYTAQELEHPAKPFIILSPSYTTAPATSRILCEP